LTFQRPEQLRKLNCLETARNGERSGTLDGLKRLQNHVHAHASKTKESL